MNRSCEDRMLVHVLQHPRDEQWIQTAKKIGQPAIDWPAIIHRAHAAHLGPLLYRQLEGVGDALNIPKEKLDGLKSEYLRNLALAAYREIELKRILEGFQEADLASILLKGAALSEAVFRDKGARVYGDLDIMVPKSDLERARSLLQRMGYQSQGTAETQAHYQKSHHHLAPMIHPDKSVVVELHWTVHPRIHVDIDSWWKRSAGAQIQGIPVRILGWTDMLLHLCLHLFSSGETRTSLRGLVDIYRTLVRAGRNIDWVQFDADVQRYGVQEEVYAVLQTVRTVMDSNHQLTAWPDAIPANPALVTRMKAVIFSMEQSHTFPGSLIAIQAETSWTKKIALLGRRFFPPVAVLRAAHGLSHSSWKVYGYYLLRPIQLIWRYGRVSRHLLGTK